ncbi:MAG TPA: hypothetical protein H9733_06815 [Candidatus Anaerotignum merdipullorum]|nr:hypothetical protein [Candidatus Anaerotignum merdipullorum]
MSFLFYVQPNPWRSKKGYSRHRDITAMGVNTHITSSYLLLPVRPSAIQFNRGDAGVDAGAMMAPAS